MTNDQLIDEFRDASRDVWACDGPGPDAWIAQELARVVNARAALLAAMTKRTDTQPPSLVNALMALVDQYAYNHKGNFDGGARDRVERALIAALVKR